METTTATKAKAGRKQKHFEDPETGLPVIGLTRRPDGRWRVIGTHQTFREPDVKKAIQKFYTLTGDKEKQFEQKWLERERHRQLPITRGQMVDWARRLILQTPQLAAKELGIEWLAYGPELRAPEKLPSLDSLEKQWRDHGECLKHQRRKVLRAWQDFRKTTGIAGLKDITAETAIAFKDAVRERGLSKKQQQHIFAGVRRVLTFSVERGIAVKACNEALGYLASLKAKRGAVELDPRPIERGDWDKLRAVAKGDDLAMILLMLNGAFYVQEVIRLMWSDIRNGCIVTNREKTGKCIRVCVLWPETLDALAKVKRRGDHIFLNYRGEPLGVKGAQIRFTKLVIAAGLRVGEKAAVTTSQLRDGAATAAAEANVNSDLCKILRGARCGIDDHYVARNPKMVAPACEAVYAKYFG